MDISSQEQNYIFAHPPHSNTPHLFLMTKTYWDSLHVPDGRGWRYWDPGGL